jgi:hypothetical protein
MILALLLLIAAAASPAPPKITAPTYNAEVRWIGSDPYRKQRIKGAYVSDLT